MGKKHVRPLHNTELSEFCEQTALLLRSGASPLECVSLIRDDLGDAGLKEALAPACGGLEMGMPLFESLERTGLFPSYFLRMVQIGENSGRTDEVLASLADYYRREEEISQSVRRAVTYPLVMILLMLGVVLVLVIKVLPIFNDVLSQLGTGLTRFSRGLMDFGQAVSSWAAVLLALAGVLLLAGLFLFRSARGRALRTKLASKLVFTRGVSEKVAAGRFAFVMSVALSSGLDTDRSLEFAAGVTEDPRIRGRIEACRTSVAAGESFPRALSECGVFPGVYARMASAAFRAGSLDSAMHTISDRCQEEADQKIDRAVSLVEPTLVAVLSVLVGAILLSVILPLMGVMSGL